MVIHIDEEIVLRVQQGDTQAFGILVKRYEQKIMRYARRFLFGQEDAQDATQEVFLKAYANIQSFNHAYKFSSWLYRIAHNEFINALKKKKRMPILFFDFDTIFPYLSSRDTADSQANEKELKSLLDKHLRELSPKYREPLILYYFEEMNYKEIAEVLRIPIATVGVRLKRGKDLLKRHIAII